MYSNDICISECVVEEIYSWNKRELLYIFFCLFHIPLSIVFKYVYYFLHTYRNITLKPNLLKKILNANSGVNR